jgi:hypothetical protein
MMLLMRRKVYAELGASCAGVSDPPHRWHSGPGVKLRPRDPGWFVVAHEWPQYSVERESHVSPAEKVSQATALATAEWTWCHDRLGANLLLAAGRGARGRGAGDVRRRAAQGAQRTRAVVLHERVTSELRRVVVSQW